MFEALDIVRWFLVTRRLDRITSRTALEAHQDRWLGRLRRRVLSRSPFYAAMADAPYETWPIVSKSVWMGAFDRINTRGVTLHEALAVADAAERSRDFRPGLRGITVGLSTGTSGQRGVFLVSPAERRRWAGMMLARLLPKPILAPRRVAFFLRANSTLYEQVEASGRITFRFFDLMAPLEESAGALNRFQPDVLIAPPSVLSILARLQRTGALSLRLARVVSIAEVLHADDRAAVEGAFGLPLHQVYQATEGALAMTCEAGGLHLNEAFVKIEPRWLDAGTGRFSPIVTDLTRATQPVVRYLLDDVLIVAPRPCVCGRAALTLQAIEGRSDEICTFRTSSGAPVRVFPDYLARAILGAVPEAADFQVVQPGAGVLQVSLQSAPEDANPRVLRAIKELAARLGAEAPEVLFVPWAPQSGAKRRRIATTCAPRDRGASGRSDC